jgi:hypothetical protein
MKWIVAAIVVLVCVFFWFSLAQGQSLRSASLIRGSNSLRVALVEFKEGGKITNYPTTGIQVSLSTNVVSIGGTQYVCFAEARGGWGYGEGALAMTTNQLFIWLDPMRPPKILTNGYRPPFFRERF